MPGLMAKPTTTSSLSKKRSAPSQKGPASIKKQKSTSSSGSSTVTSKSKSKSSKSNEGQGQGLKKRSRPVTMPVSSAPDEEDDEDDWEDEIEEVPADDDFEADPDAMVIDTPAPAAQPHPNAPPKQSARESHAVQKATHQARMAAKPHSSLLIQAKHAWSLARRKTVPSPAERQADIQRLMGVIRGHVKEVVFKHDASRIVQTVVKYGSAAEREEVVVELKGSFVQLAQSRYSKVCCVPFTFILIHKLIKCYSS